jgi:hypothetical protein
MLIGATKDSGPAIAGHKAADIPNCVSEPGNGMRVSLVKVQAHNDGQAWPETVTIRFNLRYGRPFLLGSPAACVEAFPRFRPVSVAFRGTASCPSAKTLNKARCLIFVTAIFIAL